MRDRCAVLRLFADHLLPVFLIAGAGYLFARHTRIDPRPISRLAFTVLAPTFVFSVIAGSAVTSAGFFRMVGFAATALLALAAIAALVGKALRWPDRRIAAAVLVVMLPNAGNFGLSANLFAFGAPGLAEASLFFVTSSVLTFSVAPLVASLGAAGARGALLGLARTPALWAVVAAFAIRGAGITLPLPVSRSLELVAGACVPMFILILGIQLHRARAQAERGALATVVALRLAGGAALGLALAPLFGLEGAARQAGVLQCAMPSAVISTIIAGEYDVEPDFVAAAVLASTLASPLTLTPLLAWLGA